MVQRDIFRILIFSSYLGAFLVLVCSVLRQRICVEQCYICCSPIDLQSGLIAPVPIRDASNLLPNSILKDMQLIMANSKMIISTATLNYEVSHFDKAKIVLTLGTIK